MSTLFRKRTLTVQAKNRQSERLVNPANIINIISRLLYVLGSAYYKESQRHNLAILRLDPLENLTGDLRHAESAC